MRTLNRNKQRMKYSNYKESLPVYERDSDGNIIYISVDGENVPIETGEYETGYEKPTCFRANINSTLTEAFIRAFGVDKSSNKSTIVCSKGFLPFEIGTRIWRKSEVRYKDTAKTIVDGDSADYEVVAVNDEALNEDMFLLQKLSNED